MLARNGLAPEHRQAARPEPRWYSDPLAIATALAINGYPMSAIVATVVDMGESQMPSIVVRLIALLFSALAVVVAMRRVRLQRLDMMLVALWIMYLARLLYDLNTPSILGTETALLFFTLTCVAPAIAIALAQNTWSERNTVLCLIATGVFVCLASLWIKDSLVSAADYAETAGRLSFQKLNPITLGHVACTTALASLVLLLQKPVLKLRILAGTAIALSVVLMVLAASRGALVTFMFCIGVLVLCRQLWGYALAATAMVAITVFAILDVDALLQQTGLAHLGREGEDQSGDERRQLIGIALLMIKDHWEFGSGYTLPYDMGYPHNVFIEAWMAMGIVGFLLFSYLAIRSVISALYDIAGDRPMMGFILMQFLTAAQFSGALYAGWPGMWIGMAALLGASLASPRPAGGLRFASRHGRQ